MSITKFKNFLNKQDEKSLINELIDLYKTFESVREFYVPRIDPNSENKIIEKYEKILAQQFFPEKGFPKLNFTIANKAISDFKKVNSDPKAIIDLQLTYVELGVMCTRLYGDIDEKFYNRMAKMFSKALKDACENGLLNHFQERCLDIRCDTSDIGWGFGYEMAEICEEYFPSDQ